MGLKWLLQCSVRIEHWKRRTGYDLARERIEHWWLKRIDRKRISHREIYFWECVLGKFQLFLLGRLFRVNKSASPSFENSELFAPYVSKSTRSKWECLSYTCCFCKLNKAKLVITLFVGIFPSVSDSKVYNNATFMLNFKELFEPCKVDFTDRMNPNSSIQAFLIKILHPFE